MKASGNKPPMTVASKGSYMLKDLQRNASYFGVEINLIEVNCITSLQLNVFMLGIK